MDYCYFTASIGVNDLETTLTMHNTPINQTTRNEVTDNQSTAYNALLTQLAKIIGNLQKNVYANLNLDKGSNAVACWQYLLHDLTTVVLPEFYVVFHDRTTHAVQRRRLYDVTQAIYFAMVIYDSPIFIKKVALCDIEAQPLNTLAPKSYLSNKIDSYLTGEGDNVKTAFALRRIADYINVDGAVYIKKFVPYYDLLISEHKLLKSLQNNTLANLQKILRVWQQQRFSAFSFPDNGRVMPSNLKADHALASWMLASPKRKVRGSNSHELDTFKPVDDSLIADTKSLQKGVKYGAISLVLFAMASSSGIGFVLFGLFYLMTTLVSAYSVSDSLNYKRYLPAIQQYNGIAFIVAIITLFFGGIFSAVAIHVIATTFFVYRLSESPSVKAAQIADASNQAPTLANGSQTSASQQKTTRPSQNVQDFETIKKTAVDIEPHPPSKNYDLPLDINRHGYHLAILLSDAPTEHLKQLIESTNKLYNHLDYLQQAHPYLATRVDELVKDLTHNTIVRLDELANQFVIEGQVSTEAREVFIEQHEKRVDGLIVLNLEQVNGLNKTILEKQMAGFADIGNAIERQFRDSVMELKILLRWLIAQQPDEVQASNHEVILENLETTTLVDMQTAFFDNQTTSEQREELQAQIEALIQHFKQQTPHNIHQYSHEQEDTELQELLQLSKSKASNAIGIDLDSAGTQAKTQAFIDYNKQYVKQLLKHWH